MNQFILKPVRLLPSLTLLVCCGLAPILPAEPLFTSWLTELSGRYARIYPDNVARDAQEPITTWARGAGLQSQPTYAGVHEVAVDSSKVYIRTTNLGFHIMGPWHDENGNLFPDYPANTADIYCFPRVPNTSHSPKTPTNEGANGYFVDGVSAFDSRDTFSYDTSAGQDDREDAAGDIEGDGIWNRDAYMNEGDTFDPANGQQVGARHHYHVSPLGLRHLLGDSVDYEANIHRYTENFNGNHSPILGWMRDGLPIYGPYAYSDPLDASSPIRRMISGYQKRDGTNGSTNLNIVTGTDLIGNATGRTTLPQWVARNDSSATTTLANTEFGPVVSSAMPIGHYLEDYAYKGDLVGFSLYEGVSLNGVYNPNIHYDLNEYNVRFCVTPDFPNGTYAYFTNITESGTPVYPYHLARYFFAEPTGDSLAEIPAGVTSIWEGGPEKPLDIDSLAVDHANGDVTLSWSSVQGGDYSTGRSGTLEPDDWETLTQTLGADALTSITDIGRANVDDRHFYQVALNHINSFDDEGFDYDNTVINQEPQNNVLLLILDDWGIDSSELYNTEPGARLANMPHLKSLLYTDINSTGLPDKGLLFTRGYAQPICSPTRATMLTGRQPYQHGVGNPNTDSTLPSSELTFPEIITAEAPEYGLASFGKWHLGSGSTGPFDTGGWPHFSGTEGGGLPAYNDWTRITIENGVLTDSGTDVTTYATTAQVDGAISFINDQNTNPWIVWMGFNAPHSPFHDPSPFVTPTAGYSTNGNSNSDLYIRMLEALDHEIGRLLSSIDLDRTNIIVVGDNGSPGQVVQAPAGGLAGAKGSLTEGGIHVPFFSSGPDIIQTGTTDEFVHVIDLFATILELAKVNITAATEGIEIRSKSIVPIFKETDRQDRCIVSEKFGDASNGRSLIIEDWPQYKLISTQNVTDPDDIPNYQMYFLGANGVEASTLATPPNSGDSHEAAYLSLVEKDERLVPIAANANSTTIHLRLAVTTGAASPPPNQRVLPTSVTYQGTEVQSIEGRLDTNDMDDRYWVKILISDDLTIDPNDLSSFTVTFPNNTNGGNNTPRVFTPIEIVISSN